jgi:hypothetical protein
MEKWDIRSPAIEPHHPQGAELKRRDPHDRHPNARKRASRD